MSGECSRVMLAGRDVESRDEKHASRGPRQKIEQKHKPVCQQKQGEKKMAGVPKHLSSNSNLGFFCSAARTKESKKAKRSEERLLSEGKEQRRKEALE